MKTRKLGKQAKRALEALDVLNRREQVKNHVAQTRAKETEQKRASQRKHLREHIAASPSHYITIILHTLLTAYTDSAKVKKVHESALTQLYTS